MKEFITCSKCKKQQRKENFWYNSSRHEVCKFCNKKTNIIPNDYNITTDEISNYLNKTVFNQENNIPISTQLLFNPVFEFLERQKCKEVEATDLECDM